MGNKEVHRNLNQKRGIKHIIFVDNTKSYFCFKIIPNTRIITTFILLMGKIFIFILSRLKGKWIFFLNHRYSHAFVSILELSGEDYLR